MKLNEITGMQKAISKEDLIASIKGGKFTKDGSHLIIPQNFHLVEYGLTSLVGCPSKVDGNFYCGGNKLSSLKGCPKEIGGDFGCSNNNLTSLEGCPEEVGAHFFSVRNHLTSLEGIHKHLKKMDNGVFSVNMNPITSHVLGLLKIPGCRRILLDNSEVQDILNKYLPLGDLLDCQEELIEAGFEEFAQL